MNVQQRCGTKTEEIGVRSQPESQAIFHTLPSPPVRMLQVTLDKAIAGERLTPAEGLRLIESHDLAALGQAADAVTRRLHPESYRTYNIDRNINYTNVCTAVCDFCAFYRPPKDPEGYVLDRDVLLEKIRETVASGRRSDSHARGPASAIQARLV